MQFRIKCHPNSISKIWLITQIVSPNFLPRAWNCVNVRSWKSKYRFCKYEKKCFSKFDCFARIVCLELTKHDALNAIATVTTITYMVCTYDTYIAYYYHYDYNINNHYLYSKSTPFNGLSSFSLLRRYCTRRGVKNKSQKENRAKWILRWKNERVVRQPLSGKGKKSRWWEKNEVASFNVCDKRKVKKKRKRNGERYRATIDSLNVDTVTVVPPDTLADIRNLPTHGRPAFIPGVH